MNHSGQTKIIINASDSSAWVVSSLMAEARALEKHAEASLDDVPKRCVTVAIFVYDEKMEETR